MAITTLRRAAVTGLSLLAMSFPAAAAHAAGATAATPRATVPCARQAVTVKRHEEALLKMRENILGLDVKYQDADAKAEWTHIDYYEWRDAARMDDQTEAEKAYAEQRAAKAYAEWQQASAEAKEARQALQTAEQDPQLAKTASLLKRARTALATCLAKV